MWIDIYLEISRKRTIAGAVEWPGWCRSGRDEEQATQALFDYAPRYARVMQKLGFKPPKDLKAFNVVERLEGDASTDYGIPGAAPRYDAQQVDAREHKRLEEFLETCWAALDGAAKKARGKELRKGPRGGGRELEDILQHVLDGEGGYIYRLAWKRDKAAEADARLSREAILQALAAAVRGETPSEGPRGGKKWTPRYFVRREAWHVLDHTWEIEDRT